MYLRINNDLGLVVDCGDTGIVLNRAMLIPSIIALI